MQIFYGKGVSMKIQFLFSIIIALLLTSHSGKAQDYQLPGSPTDIITPTSHFNQPVFFNGIENFLKFTFNSPLYGEFFAVNPTHMRELLEHSCRMGKSKTYTSGIFNLFTNKLKSSAYVNPYAYLDFIAGLEPLIGHHFAVKATRANFTLKDIIFELQYQAFKTNFPEFKLNPTTFLTDLSQQIEAMTELRKKLVLFFEVSLNKLIWSPDDQFDTWQNVKQIADQLAHLYRKTIISSMEDLDNLYITLLERYCFFLNIVGSSIEIDTFQKIKQDIENNYISLFDVGEQEDILETKLQRFTRCLLECEAKARAHESGIVLKQ